MRDGKQALFPWALQTQDRIALTAVIAPDDFERVTAVEHGELECQK